MKQIACITGSSRGIGKAIALRLAQENFQIIIHGSRESEALTATAAELEKLDALAAVTFFDVANPDEVDAACTDLLEKVGTIDVLVNNAAIVRDKPFSALSPKDWDEVIKTNLYGPFYVTRHFVPQMKKQKFGRIINMSSIAARGAFGKTNYSAAKAGLIGFSKSLALEVAKYNITVNVVCPGFIDTEMNDSMPTKYQEQLLAQVAVGRKGSPAEVAHLVAFLASRQSSYVTGAVLDVNGGLDLEEQA